MSRFSEWLARAMFESGGRKYTQKKLATELGKREASVSGWLNDKEKPEDENIRLLARHFGVTVKFIYELLERDLPETFDPVLDEIESIAYKLPDKARMKFLRETLEKVKDETKADD